MSCIFAFGSRTCHSKRLISFISSSWIISVIDRSRQKCKFEPSLGKEWEDKKYAIIILLRWKSSLQYFAEAEVKKKHRDILNTLKINSFDLFIFCLFPSWVSVRFSWSPQLKKYQKKNIILIHNTKNV